MQSFFKEVELFFENLSFFERYAIPFDKKDTSYSFGKMQYSLNEAIRVCNCLRTLGFFLQRCIFINLKTVDH
jgi:hypothetical protein